MPQLKAMARRSREKEQKQQQINGTEKFHLKDCSTEVGQNYN